MSKRKTIYNALGGSYIVTFQCQFDASIIKFPKGALWSKFGSLDVAGRPIRDGITHTIHMPRLKKLKTIARWARELWKIPEVTGIVVHDIAHGPRWKVVGGELLWDRYVSPANRCLTSGQGS